MTSPTKTCSGARSSTKLPTAIERWTGNRASIAEANNSELDQLRENERPIVSALRRDALPVYGIQTPDLLGAS